VQLWAEALALFRAGTPWWPEAEDIEAFALEAEVYADTGELSDVEDLVVGWFVAKLPHERPLRVAVGEMIEALFMLSPTAHSYAAVRRRVTSAMSRLGFRKVREGRAWRWRTPDDLLAEKQDLSRKPFIEIQA